MGIDVNVFLHFTKRNNFCVCCLLPWTAKAFQNRRLLLTLLHSERPKSYAILTCLNEIGLKNLLMTSTRIEKAYKKKNIVTCPESVPTHPGMKIYSFLTNFSFLHKKFIYQTVADPSDLFRASAS